MLGLLNTFVSDSTVNTALVFAVSIIAVYFFVFGKKKETKPIETKDRSIKKDTDVKVDTKNRSIKAEKPEPKKEEIKSVVKAEASVPKVAQKQVSSLVQYEATVARMAVLSSNYIREQLPLKKVVKSSFLDELVAEVETSPRESPLSGRVSNKFAKVMDNNTLLNGEKVQEQSIKEGEFVKEEDVVENDVTSREIETPVDTSAAEANIVSEPLQAKAEPNPVLADFNATEAMILLEAQQFVAAMPKAPKPFLAAFNASEAMILLEAQQFVAAMPKAPKPFLAAFNASEAMILLEAQQFIASMPKAPKPFLAAFNATEAIVLQESKQYVASLPKAPKPFLADFNATEALTLLESQQYVASLPKAPKPFLADFNSSEALTLLESQKFVASMPKAPKPFLAAFNATEASIMLTTQQYVAGLPKATKSLPTPIKEEKEPIEEAKQQERSISSTPTTCEKSNLATIDATAAHQLLLCQTKSQQKDTSDSDVEVEIEGEALSPATTPSISTSSLHSDAGKFVSAAAVSTTSPSVTALNSTVTTPTQPNHFNNYSYPWFVGGNNTFMNEPTYFDNGIVGEKKQWTREQKIEKQIQSHMPKMKNRCDYWPNCTNKHCKFSHPVTPCRVGDGCPFGKRCSFIHPKDFVEPLKRRHTTNDVTGRKNSYRKPNLRSNSSFTNGKNNTPKTQTPV